METQYISLGIAAANFALTWGVALYMYLSNKNKVTNVRIDELERDVNTKIDKLDRDVDQRMDEYREKIAKLEEGAEHGPTLHDLGELHEKINKVGNDLSTIRGEMKGAHSTLSLIHEHLMKGGINK